MNQWARVDIFDDSDALAEDLRNISKSLPPEDAYYLMEAAENLDGMWSLLNELLRLKNEMVSTATKKTAKKTAKSKAE